MIYLGQIDSLTKVFREDEALNKHFDLSDFDNVRRTVKQLTKGEYTYILQLIANKKRSKLNQKMLDLGFKRNDIHNNS